jgi:tRNA pseudouridine65 synthase
MEILFEDDHIIAVNKPNGIFVHRTSLDPLADTFVVQVVRDMIGQRVYPVHRLDRKTSGVLLLAKSKMVQTKLNEIFRERDIKKYYLAIVRGYTEDKFVIDYPLKNDNGKIQEALTVCSTISKVEIPVCSGTFPTSRYSLIHINPETGRRHQIRRHLAHVLHPIIGDRPHGCNKQNKFFLSHFQMNDMLLHASEISFFHPILQSDIKITAPLGSEFERMYKELGFNLNNIH